ncbi:membrane protein insertion efficiency factor YidD [Sanguibacter suaedae]|uniref:Putative membrane protein insertion efficiency factor n=1 Tax=Sanguibacter suaedae TaxID=2795737 RepID=A0A934I807_9MICO|nr:membrane protein insertion efficiency factor YidD [Sanguibacter suaedae]MBI9114842.1 membrane protein insertion efficiency factor YidD [Sanguibacter suaedae]
MSEASQRRAPVARALRGAVRGYQKYVSPLSGPRCRFYPSCSSYAVTALETHGAVRGSALATWRVLRCNPWNDGGVDDVPPVGGARARRDDPRP